MIALGIICIWNVVWQNVLSYIAINSLNSGRALILTVVKQSRDCAPVYFHVVVSQVHSIQVLHPSGLGVDRLF